MPMTILIITPNNIAACWPIIWPNSCWVVTISDAAIVTFTCALGYNLRVYLTLYNDWGILATDGSVGSASALDAWVIKASCYCLASYSWNCCLCCLAMAPFESVHMPDAVIHSTFDTKLLVSTDHRDNLLSIYPLLCDLFYSLWLRLIYY